MKGSPPAADLAANPEIANFIRGIMTSAAEQRLPEVFAAERFTPLYHIPDREGVAVVALRTTDLAETELLALMQYRLAQYLAVNFIDPKMVYQARMEHEPFSGVSPNDVHIIAGSAADGEILCYLTILAPRAMPPGATLREPDRPFFPVENAHGWGVYNRLRLLPDLPVARVREMGRFVKNQRLRDAQGLAARAPVEVLVACTRLLTGVLRREVDAVIGELEEGVAKRNLDFFHVPLVVIHGTVVYAEKTSYKYPMYRYRNHYPFAFLISDLQPTISRMADIEQALNRPGNEGLVALFSLAEVSSQVRSSLEPREGLAPLSTERIPERNTTMSVRRLLLDVGERLRAIDLFRSLSPAEATVLSTFMERQEVDAAEVIVRQGEFGNDLFIIESGQAEVSVTGRLGESLVVATLGSGDYFGEIAVVTGGERTADVIAITPMVLRRLSQDSYTRYLSHMTEVQEQLSRTAARRATNTLHKRMPRE